MFGVSLCHFSEKQLLVDPTSDLAMGRYALDQAFLEGLFLKAGLPDLGLIARCAPLPKPHGVTYNWQ